MFPSGLGAGPRPGGHINAVQCLSQEMTNTHDILLFATLFFECQRQLSSSPEVASRRPLSLNQSDSFSLQKEWRSRTLRLDVSKSGPAVSDVQEIENRTLSITDEEGRRQMNLFGEPHYFNLDNAFLSFMRPDASIRVDDVNQSKHA